MTLNSKICGLVAVVGALAFGGCNKAGSSGSDAVPVQATTQESLSQNRQRGAETARQLANMGKG